MNRKQQVFLEEYLKCWNASEAARRAGYKGRPNTIGTRLLSNVVIQAAIKERLQSKHMTAEELLGILANQARNEAADYLRPDGTYDLKRLIADGKQRLIKGTTVTRQGEYGGSIKVEFLDPQAAANLIGKHLKTFTDTIEQDITIRIEGIDRLLDFVYGSRNPDTQGE